MLSEEKLMVKLEEYAARFDGAVNRKEYGLAHNLYHMVHTTAVMAELSEANMKKLFGDWDSDDGTETNTALDNGLFKRTDVDLVNRQCCVIRNQAYEDMALRRRKEDPQRYYSEFDYCARCQERKKRAARNWDDSILG